MVQDEGLVDPAGNAPIGGDVDDHHFPFTDEAAVSRLSQALEQGELHGHSGIIMDTVHDPKQ